MVKETFAAQGMAMLSLVGRLLFVVRRFAISLSALLALVIGWLSLAPLTALPAAPGGDKLAHITAYGALAFPISLREARQFMPFLAVFIAYGGVIELVQPLVNRYGEWADFAVNGLGCGLGFLAARLARHLFRKTLLAGSGQ